VCAYVTCCPPLWQAPADASAGCKHARPAAPGELSEEIPRLSLVTALPRSVWQEHLMPLLIAREAARLREVCKALKVLVREWPMRLEI
jgi:hypothetical protein